MRKKNSNVLKQKAKLNNIIFLNNSKTDKIYKIFKSKIFKYIGKKSFALGVSGGPDSLCLAYFSKLYAHEFKNKIYVFIVDHKIRNNSSSEALKVKQILKKSNIKSTILTWRGKSPTRNIQSFARDMRYTLIAKNCTKKHINYLLTAHHQDDQIENFLIRLFRGSGLSGLSSMSEEFNFSENLKIIRPFLSLEKRNLEKIAKKFFSTYIVDPSNVNENFLRSRIRRYRKTFDKEGFDTKKIIKTVNNLATAKKALEFYKNVAMKKYVRFAKKRDNCTIDMNLLYYEADEIVFRLLSNVFTVVAKSYYPPRSKKILSLVQRIKKTNFEKCTLNKCIIEKSKHSLSVVRDKTQYNLPKS